MISIILFLPLVGALVAALVPARWPRGPRWVALVFSGLAFALSVVAAFAFNTGATGAQLVDRVPWVPSLGIQYAVGVDGLSLPLLVLNTLLTLVAVLGSWHVERRPKAYFILLLILETGVSGVFVAMDFLLFFLFWEVELIPMYLLIGIWGGPRRDYAAIKFVVYTLFGSALMLVGILAMYFNTNPRTFDLTVMATQSYAANFQQLVFVFLFIGFAIKLPAFPFHTWLPDAHVEAPTAVSVLLAGVLLKMGGYGMLRFLVGMLPVGMAFWAPAIGVIAAINVLYGACVSLVQRDLKAMVAYSSVSHMGYVLLGMAAMTVVSLNGAAIQLFTHGAITGLLFLLVGSIYDRAHTRMIADFGGIARKTPVLAALFVLAGMASLGLPGLAGFVAEFTVFIGSYPTRPVVTILGAAGIVITAGYILWMLQRVFFGPFNPRWEGLPDVAGIDLVPLLALTAVVLVVGLVPSILTDVVNAGVAGLAPHAGLAADTAGRGLTALRLAIPR